jgi:hypothetical protein
MDVRWRCWLLFVTCAVVGCAGVQPYERENLARRGMQIDPDPAMSALDQHVYEYREGASGAYGTGSGSGCGCN